MEQNIVKIVEGQSGSQASDIIYGNDKLVYDMVKACEARLDEDKAYVKIINSSSATSLINVASTTGYSTTDVISQSGVTMAIENVQDQVDGCAFLSNTEVIGDSSSAPDTQVLSATYANKASFDNDGHLLSAYYYQILALDRRLRQLEETRIIERISELERAVKRIQRKIGPID